MPQRSKICQEVYLKKARLIHKQKVILIQNKLKETTTLRKQLTNEENLRFLINEKSMTLF